MGGRGIFLKIQAPNAAHDNAEVKKIMSHVPELADLKYFLMAG